MLGCAHASGTEFRATPRPFNIKQDKMPLRSLAAVIMLGLALVPAAADEAKLKIVTTFTVIADIARNVAGDAATVESITRPDAEIHNYQPTPGDILRAQDADLILWNGLNLEQWFERFFRNLKDVDSVVVSEGVTPLGIRDGPYRGKPNPHAWMSPADVLVYVENIRAALAARDPANAETYAANAKAYAAEIEAVAAPIRDRLAAIPEEKRWLVTSEGAFSYLARDFGLKELYLWPINADGRARSERSSTRCANIPSPSCSAKARSRPTRRCRWRARPGRIMAACSMSIRFQAPTGRCRPISTC
jgi:manganese/iron transport system substrate-binding protein